MRQRSASGQPDDTPHQQSDPFVWSPPSGPARPRARKAAPRPSLPPHPDTVDSTPAEEEPEARPQPTRKQRSKKAPSQALMLHSAETSPLDLSRSVSPADLQLIPRTSPALPSVTIKQSWFHHSSPRITAIKLILIGLVTFSVLGTTLATAGGGNVTSFLVRALESVIPYSAPAQPAGPTTVAQRVQPIIQADTNAGYDSLQQHDIWWDSACSAAAMTEVLHAWGVQNVTIGRLIDVMYAHNPPYITPWGGLMTSDAWNYVMSNYRMHAAVHTNRSMGYDAVVRVVQNQGIPIVLGIRGGSYYPALSAGHFLVVVGGDATGLRIVDSSLYRITYMTLDQFNYLWDGLTVVITPA